MKIVATTNSTAFRRFLIGIVVSLCSFPMFSIAQECDPTRWIGMKAPEFRLSGTDGRTHKLSSLTANGPVVVLWFPKAYTGNVTRMLKSTDTVAGELARSGITLVAASCDKIKYLSPYAKESGLTTPLLADPTRTTAIQWGVVHDGREIPHRWAYLIGKDGRIASILTELEAASAGDLITSKCRDLGWTE